jgi:uncharacterized LabA/DUF88 family protein
MLSSKLDPLSEANSQPVRIRFYIDGYHSYLLSKEVVGLHRSFLKPILKEYPQYSRLFDLNPSPEKRAILILSLLLRAEAIIVSREESSLAEQGLSILTASDVAALENPYRRTVPLFDGEKELDDAGQYFIEPWCRGTVFAPNYNKHHLENQINEYVNSLLIDSDYYELVIVELKRIQKDLKDGTFEMSQRFYDALADEIGNVSRRGFLKVSYDVRRKIIEEKGVDGDMIATLASDAYKGAADVFVLLTNDADHAPLAEQLVHEGKKVIIIGYASRPARALRQAVGDENILNLLTEERDFDFSALWLRSEDADSLRILEDMRIQWQWWKANGIL